VSRRVLGLWALVVFLGLLGAGTISNQVRINQANGVLARQARAGQMSLNRTCKLLPITMKATGTCSTAGRSRPWTTASCCRRPTPSARSAQQPSSGGSAAGTHPIPAGIHPILRPGGRHMKPYPGHVLRRGSTGPAVRDPVQGRGSTSTASSGCKTEHAVRRFQACHKPPLQADGEVGPITWAALFGQPIPAPAPKSLAEKAFANAVNLIGVMEVGGNNTGPMVSRIIKANGGVGPEPWCGDFVAYCYRLAGSDIVKGPKRLWAYVPWITRTAVAKTSEPSRGGSRPLRLESRRRRRPRRPVRSVDRPALHLPDDRVQHGQGSERVRLNGGRRRRPPPRAPDRARPRLLEGDAMKQEPVALLVLVACLTEAGGALTLLAADHTTAGLLVAAGTFLIGVGGVLARSLVTPTTKET
jgi:hypothetical protein